MPPKTDWPRDCNVDRQKSTLKKVSRPKVFPPGFKISKRWAASAGMSDKNAKLCGKCAAIGCEMICPCKQCYYCSKECQKADWPSHKEKCAAKNRKKVKSHGPRDNGSIGIMITSNKLSFQGPFSLDRFEELIAIPNGALHQSVAEKFKQFIPARLAGLMPKDESYPTVFTWSLMPNGLVEHNSSVVDTERVPAPDPQMAALQQLQMLCMARKTVIAGYHMEIRMRDPETGKVLIEGTRLELFGRNNWKRTYFYDQTAGGSKNGVLLGFAPPVLCHQGVLEVNGDSLYISAGLQPVGLQPVEAAYTVY